MELTKEEEKRKQEERDYYSKEEYKLPRSDKEAGRRYQEYVSRDPYPEIETALLNSADIFQYVAKTGMIYPFDINRLSGASYEVTIRGTVIWWDEEKGEQKKQLDKDGDFFELKPNSIAFITLEPNFRIPDYIALRFNLKIVHVYKGLLLGTGPLVDPGFVGHLSIPLHNLTANTYVFRAGEGMIQMEFTKLSRNHEWLKVKNTVRCWMYKRKRNKPGRRLEEYIRRALGENSQGIVKSSIPDEIKKIQKESEAIKSEAKEHNKDMNERWLSHKKDMDEKLISHKDDIDKRVKNAQIMNVATLVTIAALVVSVMAYANTTFYEYSQIRSVDMEQSYHLVQDYQQFLQQYADEQRKLEERIEELEAQIEDLKAGMAAGSEAEKTIGTEDRYGRWE